MLKPWKCGLVDPFWKKDTGCKCNNTYDVDVIFAVGLICHCRKLMLLSVLGPLARFFWNFKIQDCFCFDFLSFYPALVSHQLSLFLYRFLAIPETNKNGVSRHHMTMLKWNRMLAQTERPTLPSIWPWVHYSRHFQWLIKVPSVKIRTYCHTGMSQRIHVLIQ